MASQQDTPAATDMVLADDQCRLLWEAGIRILPRLSGDPHLLLEGLAEELVGLFGAVACRIWLPHMRPPQPLAVRASFPAGLEGDAASLPDAWMTAPVGGRSRLWLCSKPEPLWQTALAAKLIGPDCPVAMVLAIFTPDDRCQAVLSIERTAETGVFGPAAESLASGLASWLAPVFDQLRLRQEAQQQAAALQEKLAEIAEACGLANAELARAARLSDQFLANMSHELRTPLNTILGMSQALQEGVMGPVNDDQMSYLVMVEKAGRHLLTMLTDILTLSKAGAGRLEVHTERLPTQSLCQECMQFIIQPARQKHIRTELKCDPGAAMIEADENILKQILVNLLTNAVKFTGERGAISLSVESHPEQECVAFVVADSGCGIAPEHMDRLFQPFVQLNEGLARPYPGNGLGLSLIYKLTELHGGSVAVESALERGSRFTVRLPWHAGEPADPAPSAGANPKLLLVEDNQRTIKHLQQALAAAGYAVTVACQGAEALERVAQEKPPLVLVDLQLAGMSGWAFIQHIRSNPRLRPVRIVALSAMVVPGDRERCLAAGADAYFEKPVCSKILQQTVAELLASKPANHNGQEADADPHTKK